MKNPHNLQVGQSLWYVPSNRRDSERPVTVQKIGNRWAAIGYSLRIDLETLRADGGNYSSPGRCYLSEQDWTATKLADKEWNDLRSKMTWNVPSGVTLENIKAARKLLGCEANETN
jgi:hypothetical protein